jgi:hypothetical protein
VTKHGERPISTALELSEASLLGTAMCGSLILDNRLRAVVIKGPLATKRGLRPPRPSADIDILTDDVGAAVCVEVLGKRGWIVRPTDTSDVVPAHSSTLYHPSWNLDIDVHRWYPGFEAPRDQVLQLILDTSVVEDVAGVPVPAPSTTAMAVIQALHALRTPWNAQSKYELAHLQASQNLPGFEGMLAFANATGATGALRPFLEAAYSDRNGFPSLPEPSEAWANRLEGGVPGILRFHAIRKARGWRKFVLIYRALIPSRETMASMDIRLFNAPRREYWLAVWRRLITFFRQLAAVRRQH